MRKILISLIIFLLPIVGFSLSPPLVVGVPPSDAYIGLSLMPDGEIRHYNYGEQSSYSYPMYLSSRDNGMTWEEVKIKDDRLYADLQNPLTGTYIRAITKGNEVYLLRITGGIEGERTLTKIDDTIAIMLKPPLFAEGGKRIVIGGHSVDREGCFTYVSTDDGITWKKSNKVNSPAHKRGGEHKGVRWNHGAVEPTIAELPGGRLWMVMRTAQDYHYQSFSDDGGLTWSESEPSPFYGTITMPTFHKLKDGRLLFFWSNTTPLPEMASANGVWDDVFTNRNVAHVAISEDDGKTWIGMRELLLDERRNAENFGTAPGKDKSVHQVQAIELENGKVLASVGQSNLNRKLVLFDVNWLYEKERSCNFSNGLEDWSVFKYKKGIKGHCGYNRIEPAMLVDHPDKTGAKALKIGYEKNRRLVRDRDGSVWNFPASKDGNLSLSMKFINKKAKINIILNDRWFNPSDPVAIDKNQYAVAVSADDLGITDEQWHKLEINWSYNGTATLLLDGKAIRELELNDKTIHGVSYLHLLGDIKPDAKGILIENVRAGERNATFK